MNVFLAGVAPWRKDGIYDGIIVQNRPSILESFFYVDKDTERLLPYYGDFLLDSGAFTFCWTGGFDEEKVYDYLQQYAAFIRKNKVEKFFELDIDSIVGYEKVKEYRDRLEYLTGKPCIPVWHANRGKDEFIKHCEEYDYVALGGYVTGDKGADEKKRQYGDLFPWFIKTAHQHDSKIHGLGFTVLDKLKKYHFDSVDSTAWTAGNRYGYMYRFDGRSMKKIHAPNGMRIAKPKEVAAINFKEWIKFQKYAKTHL